MKAITKISTLLLIALTLILISSCADILDSDSNIRKIPIDDGPGPNLPKYLKPLQIGNKWVYHFVYYDEFGKEKDSSEIVDEIVIDTTIEGSYWFNCFKSNLY